MRDGERERGIGSEDERKRGRKRGRERGREGSSKSTSATTINQLTMDR
jgi:hypothetical protein